jgi:hypothetical protein
MKSCVAIPTLGDRCFARSNKAFGGILPDEADRLLVMDGRAHFKAQPKTAQLAKF